MWDHILTACLTMALALLFFTVVLFVCGLIFMFGAVAWPTAF